MTFYGLVAAVIFVAMTVLWVFGDEEPTGAVFVISTVAWWGSAMTLVFLGLVAISRWKRGPGRPERRSAQAGHRTLVDRGACARS